MEGLGDGAEVKRITRSLGGPGLLPGTYVLTYNHLELKFQCIQHPLLTSEGTGHICSAQTYM